MTVKTFNRIVMWVGIILTGGSDLLGLFLIGHLWAIFLMLFAQLGGAVLMMAIIFQDEEFKQQQR